MAAKSAAPWVVAGVVALVLADWGIRTRQAAPPPAAAPSAEPGARREAEAAALRRENDRLRGEVAALRAAAESGPARPTGVRQRLSVLTELRKNLKIGTSIPPLTAGGRLSGNFVALFGLSAGERQRLQDGLDAALGRFGEAMIAHATVRRDGDKLTIQVPPLEEGPALYDQVTALFQAVLGPERMAAFDAISADQLPYALNHFGAEARTLTLERLPGAAGGAPLTYSVTDSRRTGDGGWSNSSSAFSNPEQLQAYLGPVAKLVPAGY